jgi:hypothetical protein
MGWVLVIEENQAIYDEIKDALAQIDPKAELIRFHDSWAFLDWMQKLQDQEPELDPPRPADPFLGIVTSTETWKFKDVKLIGKFKALFVQKGFAKSEDDIFVLFTAYESPNFQKKRFEYRSVNNIIFKPFDKLVLLQILDVAMKGRTALKNKFAHTTKSNAEIEMLKEVKMTAIGELGFRTETHQALQPGVIAKYYADFLETRQHRSALAQVIAYEKAPEKEFGAAELRFFALDQSQSFNVQRLAQKEGHQVMLDAAGENRDAFEFIFAKTENDSLCTEIQPSIERFFDHDVNSFASFEELVRFLGASPADSRRRFIFVDHALIAGNEVKEIESFLALYPERNLGICLLCSRILPEPLERELSALCENIFYAPFNRSYIVKSLKLKWPALKNKEDLFKWRKDCEQAIHVSNPVKLVELSEAGLVMGYHREIRLGSFREFHLLLPNENEVVPLMAQCNFTAPSSDKKSFYCHFVFFGLRDHELKFVRRWGLNQYVGEKQKSGGE